MSRYERISDFATLATDDEPATVTCQCGTCHNTAEHRSLHVDGERYWVCQSCQKATSDDRMPAGVELPEEDDE